MIFIIYKLYLNKAAGGKKPWEESRLLINEIAIEIKKKRERKISNMAAVKGVHCKGKEE